MTPEQNFNQWIKQTFSEKNDDCLRIETTTENGCPDFNICCNGIDAWVESKFIHRRYPVLRKEQLAWGTRRAFCGGSVFILAAEESGMIRCYRFPHLEARSVGDDKHVEIVSSPNVSISKLDPLARKAIRKFVFPIW